MRAPALFLALLLAGCATDPYSVCKRQAYAKASTLNVGPGLLGNFMVGAIDRPRPHPPLAVMLDDCRKPAP